MEDNPHIWIVASAFAKIIDGYHYIPYDGEPSEQLVTDILNSINVRRMETHVQEGMQYGHTFKLGPMRNKARKFIIDVVHQSGGISSKE